MCDSVHIQAPDWNEELQAARDLPLGSLEERLQRDRALLQVAKRSCYLAQTHGTHHSSSPHLYL